MALVKGVCPNCSKNIEVEENDFNVVCTYCGVPFFPREAIDAYNKQIAELVNNLNVDTINVNADNIANYATLGFAALREKNHEKCGFYADDILKRKADAPEGLLFKAFFVSNNYSKEEGIRYYVSAYINATTDDMKKIILDTFKEEFKDYSLENIEYLVSEVINKKVIDDIDFIKYALTMISSSESDEPHINEVTILEEVASLYFDLSSYSKLEIEGVQYFYNQEMLIAIKDGKVVSFVSYPLMDDTVEKFAHDKHKEDRAYYFYKENRMVSIKLKSSNEELENILRDSGFTIEDIKSGCYIATCVYSSYHHKNVMMLRKYRDEVMSESVLGRLFIKVYYAVSPILVKYLHDFKWFKKINRNILDRISIKLESKGFSVDSYRDKK